MATELVYTASFFATFAGPVLALAASAPLINR